jgi:fatty-acyl-CoA synthase
VGVPHERFGESVVALVEWTSGQVLPEQEVIAHVRLRLAGHKVPRHVLSVASMQRGPNGKADYLGLQRMAEQALSSLQ